MPFGTAGAGIGLEEKHICDKCGPCQVRYEDLFRTDPAESCFSNPSCRTTSVPISVLKRLHTTNTAHAKCSVGIGFAPRWAKNCFWKPLLANGFCAHVGLGKTIMRNLWPMSCTVWKPALPLSCGKLFFSNTLVEALCCRHRFRKSHHAKSSAHAKCGVGTAFVSYLSERCFCKPPCPITFVPMSVLNKTIRRKMWPMPSAVWEPVLPLCCRQLLFSRSLATCLLGQHWFGHRVV